MEAAWWELFLGIPGDVGKVWACSKAARGGAWFLTSQSSHALGGLLVSLGWNPGLVWLLNNWVVWETPQNLPWERRDHPRCQPWCQFPFYLCQAHASAAGAGTQSLQAGSATSSGAQQPQPGPAAHGDLSLWTSTCTAGNREHSSSLPEKRWNCYPWTWDSSAEMHWEWQRAVFLSVNWYKSRFLSLGGQIRGPDTFSMTEITGGGLRIIRKAARPHLTLDKPRREDAQMLWSFCLLRDFELSLFCW